MRGVTAARTAVVLWTTILAGLPGVASGSASETLRNGSDGAARGAESGWFTQNPLLPQGNGLADVSMIDANTAIAVGVEGTIIKTTDQGLTWQIVNSGTSFSLHSVAFADERVGLAVGYQCFSFDRCEALVLRTEDAGETWSQTALPFTELRRVAFSDSDTAVAVGSSVFTSGDRGITWTEVGPSGHYWSLAFANDTVGVTGECNLWDRVGRTCRSGSILRTTDGGWSWEVQLTVPVAFYTVAFADSDVAVAMGEGLRPWSGFFVFRSTDGGVKWSGYSLPGTFMTRLTFADPQNGIALTGSYLLYRTFDKGASWIAQDTVEGLLSVRFATPNVGMAVGSDGQLALSTDGADTWSSLRRGTTRILYAVASLDAQSAIAVGEHGAILHTDDGGETWTPQQPPTSSDLRSVSFIGSSTAVAVGWRGAIVRADDGGKTWTPQVSGTDASLLGVFFSSPSTGTAVGERGVILRTTNAGESWEPQFSGTHENLYGVFFRGEDEGTVVGDNTAILRTVDGGANWIAQSGPPYSHLQSVFFSDSDSGIACGEMGKILRTQDGGLTWVLQDSGTTNHLWSLSFVDRLRGTIVGDYGLILRTDDGGNTWSRQYSPTRWDLKGVSFVDSNIGTAVGLHGTILRTITGGGAAP